MNIWTFLALVIAIVTGLMAYLWYLASHGDATAQVILITIGVLILFAVMQSFHIASDYFRNRAESQRFKANQQENFALLNNSFKTQNQALLGAGRAIRLGNGGRRKDDIDVDVDEGMFNDIPE